MLVSKKCGEIAMSNGDILRFKAKQKREFGKSEQLNHLNALMWELQKEWGKKFEKKCIPVFNRIKDIENQVLPEIIIISKKYGINVALREFEEIFFRIYKKDLRGSKRSKNIPTGKDLINEFELIKKKLRNKLKSSYNNFSLKSLHLQKIFPKINKDYFEDCLSLPVWELALKFLAYQHNCSPLTLKNKIAEANKALR